LEPFYPTSYFHILVTGTTIASEVIPSLLSLAKQGTFSGYASCCSAICMRTTAIVA
jgi:hypothetical protein